MKKTLAIQGHSKRGKEIIEILEMLGGQNKADLDGDSLYFYYIDCNNHINLTSDLKTTFMVFSLEKFLEEYPYKIGDRVNIECCKNVEITKIIWDGYQIIYDLYDCGLYTIEELQPYNKSIYNKEINNFDLIIPYLHFQSDKSLIHFVQIIKRRKDKGNEDMKKDSKIIKTYYIDNLEYLESHKEEMIKLANMFDARVYIHMTPCSKKQITDYCAKKFVEAALNQEYNLYKTIINSACGVSYIKEYKTFLVDLDYKDTSLCEQIINDILPEGDKIILKVPTISGVHLICKPFNTLQFKQYFPDVDIHKHNPTLLYYKNE